MTTRRERALGALIGLAVGDALGMPTQGYSPDRIRSTVGRVSGLLPAPPDHPIAAGLPAGSVTDDTEQALLLADLLIEDGGRVDPGRFAGRLAAWEDRMRERGSLDLLGPSTRRAVQAVQGGVPPELAGTTGTTNGAAMRIAPVGIATAPDDLFALLDRVEEACLVSHATSVAIAGAAAVAAAVSAAVEGWPLGEVLALAVRAAGEGARRGTWAAGADVASRIAWVLDEDAFAGRDDGVTDLVALIGTSLATQESVPIAFGMLARHPDDPWAACCEAAGLGGDTDTIAAMAGAMGGAACGASAFPPDAVATVLAVNALDLEGRVDALLTLR